MTGRQLSWASTGQGEHAVLTIDAAGGQAADLRAGCGVQRASSLVSSPRDPQVHAVDAGTEVFR